MTNLCGTSWTGLATVAENYMYSGPCIQWVAEGKIAN